MVRRFPDWPERLHVFLESSRQNRFSYGHWDCCLFVADAIQAITGSDLATEFRGKYSTRSRALQIAEPTVRGIVEGIAESHGLKEISPLMAQRGDMALIPRANGRDHSLGMVALSGHQIVIALRKGFGLIPLARASRGWRI